MRGVTSKNDPVLRVAINAQMHQTGIWGGIEQFTIGLVQALGKLDGTEEYAIVVHRTNRNWLDDYVGPNERIVLGPPSNFEAAKLFLGPFRGAARRVMQNVRRLRNHRDRLKLL